MAMKFARVVESRYLGAVMNPTTLRLTLDEFLQKYGGDYAELIDGVVVPLIPAGLLCGVVGARIIHAFGEFIDQHNLGVACSHDTFVLIRKDPPRVRGADLCFWPHELVPSDGVPDGVIESPPTFCVEMRSPTHDWPSIFEKVADYLSAGVKAVVVVDPYTKTASTYRKSSPPEVFTSSDTLTLPDVLPGFEGPVARFFE
jgi:Uma2 family endonuclease